MVNKFNFYTAYNQFYIADKDFEGNTGSDFFWDDEAFIYRLAIDKDILGISTACYGNVKGELVILKEAVDINNYNFFDHIVEGGIEVKTGFINILDCPNNSIEMEIKVMPGKYRVRIYSFNLNSITDEDDGDDYYKIEIWPDDNMKRKILKQYRHHYL